MRETNTHVLQENDTQDFAPKLWSNLSPIILKKLCHVSLSYFGDIINYL